MGVPLRALLSLLLVLVAGCNPQEQLLKLVPAEDQALASKYVDLLRARSFDEIDKAAAENVRGPKLYAALLKMTEVLPEQEPTSKKLVGAQIQADKNGTTTNIVYEYEFSGKWVLANVAMLRTKDSVSLVGLSVRPIPESLEERHRFKWTGKPALNYVVLALAIVFPLLTLYALVACVRMKMAGPKWPWLLVIVLGVGNFAVNWTTGEWQLAALVIRLFSASAGATLYGPWFVSVSLPLGALVFLFRRKALAAAVPGAPGTDSGGKA